MRDSLRSINSPCPPVARGLSLTRLQKSKIDQLMGAWEEPEVTKAHEERIPIVAIIQFRQSLSYLNTSRPFSTAFGPASTRAECIHSSEAVYSRLVGVASHLKFDLIALLAIDDNGEVDEEKLKELIRVFRPDREGNLNLLEFAKSIDTVYKELRLLRASVANSSKMDRAFENIINIVFYFLVFLCILAGVGVAPDSVLSPIGAFIVGLGFMIGSASSKYLEGILFILLRRPYDIGDRINISDPLKDTSVTGSPGWIVKDVNLYSTTVIYASTNEEATYSNGSLASSRTINMARSFKAQISCTIRFPVDAPYEKLLIFKKSIEKFILSRPREYCSFIAFRATAVEAHLGYVEYAVYALMRASWQEAPSISQSKADLSSFALELSKKMDLRYRSPPMPVDLTLLNAESKKSLSVDGNEGPNEQRRRSSTFGSMDLNSINAMFNTRR
ncbi:hypothetical protein MPSEU_000635600 [Mayamaea pseudoterrestris]|nr:hypothetical protein MPSEU_000635600 [Mayamaea pseudoterrestris]